MTKRPGWVKLTLPLAVLATGIALSLGLGYAARQEIERGAEVRFDSVAAGVARKVEDQFEAYTEVLIGLRALFNTNEAVTRDEFRQYVAGLGLQTNFPGFRALNFVAHVPLANRAAFDERMRREAALDPAGYGKFAIMPAGERAEYYPLAFIEPMEGNEKALGNDLGTNPTALKALQKSRDTGALVSSGRMIYIGGNKTDIGLAIRLPVYRAGMPKGTVEERRTAYRGSVGAGFRVAHMLREIVKDDEPGALRLRFFDGGPGALPTEVRPDGKQVATPPVIDANLLFDSVMARAPAAAASAAAAAPASAAPASAVAAAASGAQPIKERANPHAFERRLAFDFGGRVWVVQVTEDKNRFVSRLDRAAPWFIVICGSAISLLLAGIVYALATSRGRALGIATAMTSHLRTSERRLDEAQHLASLGSWILDADTGALHCSDEARRILGFDEASNTVPNLADLLLRVPAEERAAVERDIAEASCSNERKEFEHRLCLADGTERWVHVIVQLTEEDGKTALRGTVRDDTQRHKAALRLKFEHDIARLLVSESETEQVMSSALEAICTHLGWDYGGFWSVAADGLARCSSAWNVCDAPALDQFTGISRSLTYRADEGSLGRAWTTADVVCVDTATAARDFTRDALARQAGLAMGVVIPMAAGNTPTALEFFCRKPRVADAETLESLRAVAMQIGQYEQRKQAEQALRHVASHDSLTGLSNRASLQQRLSWAIKRAHRHQKRLAVMFVDLDRFKHINDTLGHGVGDAMIKACATRLGGVLREGDAVARFGGDEFVLMLEDLSKASDAAVVADKVLACCAEPFIIEGRELHVSASIGVSVYPEDGTDGETLLKNADTAMYRAKDKGRGTYQFYAAQMNAQGTERLMLESGLRRAEERGELELHYQPKMNLRTRQITGVEALMRWRHPVLGLISPVQFIPIAEETGLIESMGRWALEKACSDARAWQESGLPAIQMSVNLSTRQLNSPRLIDDIAEILNSTGFEPGLLELEITESAMMRNPDHAAGLLKQMRDMGVRLAIDDFGTGYSSLSYLTKFPLTTVKIDRSFVKDLAQDGDAEALTDAIITLAHGLRMKVVAEGVETVEQLTYLRAHDCDEIQGYWLCKPIPAEEAGEFMARHLRKLFASAVAA